ncbi:calcineurin B homologous protein 1-like [Lytechinus pictus]|uniref:calcineurin B homologous protein 1-like n=1 Tax=Lytechinus pictus TaxID=7653 RepID=UPI00240D8E0C|nr:calcineurin B homologous protein 1-like [Lytechinus pictus]
MGSRTSSLLQQEEIEEIQQETGFSPKQIVRLYSRFTNLDKSDRGMLRVEDLYRIPELVINPLGERIIQTFFLECESDQINFRQFMTTLGLFRPYHKKHDGLEAINTREKKLKFAFQMYDVDNDGSIARDELLVLLHMMVGSNITEEQLGAIADRTLTEADLDQDGQISFDEFLKALEKSDIEQMMSIRFLN